MPSPSSVGSVSASHARERDLEDVTETVRGGLVGAEEPERLRIPDDQLTQEGAEPARRLGRARARPLDGDGELAKVGQDEVLEQLAAVRVRVRTHATLADGGKRAQLGQQAAAVVEQLLRAIAAQPRLEDSAVALVLPRRTDRHLVRAPRPFDLQAVDLAGAGPALRRAQDQHRPARPLLVPVCSCTLLDLLDVVEGVVEHAGEPLVHVRVWLVEARVDDQRSPAVALEEGDELVLRNAREHGRVRDLVAVQVQDRQDGTVDDRVQELVRMPARRERSRFGLAVADDAGDDEIGIVEGRPECM